MEPYQFPTPVPSSTLDSLEAVLASLNPFDRAVVHLRYRAGQNLARIAEGLSSTPEQVAVALMGVYRRTAAAVEG